MLNNLKWPAAILVTIALVITGVGIVAVNRARSTAAKILTLATTSSTDNSGLLGYIHPRFEKQTGITIKVIAKGTGAALQLARDGNADLVLVHARKQEDEFVAAGFGVKRYDLMYNDFVIIGPADDPAKIADAASPSDAMQRLADGRHVFISRGDNSGTHVKEQQLWRETGLPLNEDTVGGKTREFRAVRPDGDWYWSIGQGMGKTITMATERRAYTLADRGTYYAFAMADPPKTDLTIVFEGGRSLQNPYGIIAVSPDKHPHVNSTAAQRYIEWITSDEIQEMIGNYKMSGKVLFHPNP
jgi:tungstate transport system substrate-binding protein